jgi:prepilin-type N-terminal cleavage/methylation domain-containing protein
MSNRAGFTTIELIMVVIIVGIIATVAFPRIRGALASQNVRSARAASTTFVTTARAAAVQRGCRGTLHMRADGRMWVTVCTVTPGVGKTLDTLGTVEPLGQRYSVTVAPSRDSVAFDARGMKSGFERVTVVFANNDVRDSLIVNELGKVVRQ